jgi:hypothetical protein
MDTTTSKERKVRYEKLLDGLEYVVHELPAGVLFGADGASSKQCAELMADLNEFEKLCIELDRPQAEFIEACRWHFDHYPHFLGRRRHFANYAEYISGRGGPIEMPRARR